MSAKGIPSSPKTKKKINILYKYEIQHQNFPQGEKGILSQDDKTQQIQNSKRNMRFIKVTSQF